MRVEPRATSNSVDKYYTYGSYEWRSKPEVAAALSLGALRRAYT